MNNIISAKRALKKRGEWKEQEHPSFGDHGKEPAKETEALLGRTGIFPRIQWTKGKFSIISPCEVTFDQYELYPVNGDVMRFDTLGEAQAYADSLTTT